jgi:hypothetical protein
MKKRELVLNAKPGKNRALIYRWVNKYGNSIPYTILKIYSFNMKYFFNILFTFQKKDVKYYILNYANSSKN